MYFFIDFCLNVCGVRFEEKSRSEKKSFYANMNPFADSDKYQDSK